MIHQDGVDTPVLVMKNGETIDYHKLKSIHNEVSSWIVHAVFLYSCYSLASDALAFQFYKMGAKVVFGYEDKVETTLATEITNLFWTNYKVNQTSLEGAFVQTKEAYKHAHNLATFLYNIILGLPDVLLELLILAGESGILATALWLISIFWGEFFAALVEALPYVLLVILAIIVILMIVWGVTHVPWPLRMKDYNGETETKI